MASQINSLTIVYSGADQRKHQSSTALAQRASYAENVSIWWRYHEIDTRIREKSSAILNDSIGSQKVHKIVDRQTNVAGNVYL